MTPPIGSILLGTTDPERLRAWYSTALGAVARDDGFIMFGEVGLLIDGRDDVAASTTEPGRVIVNFHVDDARALEQHLDAIGATWLSRLAERDYGMLFGTLIDPDGNYVQIIELGSEYNEMLRNKESDHVR
ncbi:VOC family protein [Antrihabitans cavernicola]|uniref:VOC family protein n=1 Tax=Antrihabitans cavernicola TaxID=2495913 RepID=A0A5A7S8G3_9NOCA|nr:VOC family protein [Spelaeibacter cavernicola]KAA0022448.1 VOC family protein [Spelaeibacter cavernicola]